MANRINVVLGLDTTAFQRSIARVEKQLGQFGARLESVGANLTQRLTLPMLAVGAAAVKSFADLEKLNKGLTAIMGSSDLAAEELQKLREVAKLPGLGLKEAVQGSINLQAVGLSADEARQTLFGFGKALAAVGKGKVELEAIQYQLTQMISKNKLLAEDYKVIQSNLPLMAAGMERAFGTKNIEAIRATGISAKEFTLRLSQALAQLPATQNVTGGLSNAFENFTDNLFIAGAQMGAAINKALNLEGILSKLSTAVQRAADWFSSLNPSVQKTIVIVGLAVAAIGPLLFAVGSIAKVSAIAVLGFGKLVVAAKAVAGAFTLANAAMLAPIVAIGLLIAGIVSAYRQFEGFRKVVNGIGYALKEFAQIAKEAGQAVFAGFAELKEGNFKAAAKKFGEAIIKTNPVGIAITEGKRLQDAFKQGFEDDTDYVGKTLDKFKKIIAAAKKDLGGGGGDEEGGGGTGAPITTEFVFDYRGIAAGFKKLEQLSLPLIDKLKTKFTEILPTNVNAKTKLLNLLPEETQNQFQRFTNEVLPAFNESLLVAEERGIAFGTSFGDVLKEKIGLTSAALSETIAVFGLNSEQAEILRAKLAELNLEFERIQELQTWGEAIGAGINAIAGSLSNLFQDGIGSAKRFGQAIKSAAREAIKALIQTGVAAMVRNELLSAKSALLGILALPLAAAAGQLAAGLFSSLIGGVKVPALARGGLVTSEQLVTVGDNPSGKEAIIPFERMGEFLNMAGGGGAMRVTGLFEVRGSDLVLVLDRAKQEQLRVR